MVTGQLAVPGKSQLSVASAVMEKDPEPVSRLQPSTPPALDRAIRVCLAKDPEDRWQTARDLLRELTWIAEGGSQVTPSPASAPTRRPARWRRTLLWGSGSLVLAAIAGLVGWNLRPPPAPRPVTRAVIALPPGQRLAGLDKPALALSRDGTQLVYVATQDGVQRLHLRAMDSLEARPIPGTEGAVNPFFSPDGQWLGFFAGQKLKRVPVSGGAVLTLGDVADPEGASWGSQGMVAFAPSTVSALLQVPEGGGPARPLTRLDNEATHRWPTFLRDGQAVLFAYGTATGNWEVQNVAVQSVGTGERRNLVRDGAYPAYAPSGHVVYAQRGNLMAIPFDAERLAVTGAAVPVVEGVLQASTGASQYSISASGSLVYVSGGAQSAQLTPVWVTRDGVEQPVAGVPARGYAYPRLSPDGLRLAVGVAEPDPHVFVFDLAREVLTRLTRTGTLNALATWTPDGQRVVFTSDREGPRNLYWQRTDGSGEAERLTTSPYNHTPMSWSPDGQVLVFGEINHPDTGFDIWQLRISDRTTQPVIRTAANESTPRLSPDGRWLAYASDESGRQEIYVQPYPGPGGRWQVSADGGREPVWNPSGRELFYRSGDKMMVADIATQPGFSSGRPRLLFEGPYEPTVFTVANYDVSPDGRRFLMLRRTEHGAAAPTQINVVLNWADELTRRVPAGKP
jgi:serine/threonine-protein kinase